MSPRAAWVLAGPALLLWNVADARGETSAAPQQRGAVVVAIGDGATAAAQALARTAYRDDRLRPGIEEPTARVLSGEAPAPNAPSALIELAELRTQIDPAQNDAAARRLLASIGAETRAVLVVAVALPSEDQPAAQVLRVATGRWESVRIGATVETSPEGERRVVWPGAVETLRGLLAPAKPAVPARTGASLLAPPAASSAAPFANAAQARAAPAPADKPPFYKSPWFWVPVGLVAAAGVTVFVAANATENDTGTVKLRGRVAP